MKIAISLVLSFFLASSVVLAEQFNLEVKGEYEHWNTSHIYGGLANGAMGGIGLGYYKGKYYGGAGFSVGNFVLEEDDEKELQRIDFDAVIGKKLDDQWSVFTGYRFNRFNYSSKATPSLDARENTLGAGAGVSFTVAFSPKMVGFMSGVVSGLYSYNNNEDEGKGFSVGSEGGILVSINPKTSISVRVKYQTTNIIYDLGDDWVHAYNRIGANLGYVF